MRLAILSSHPIQYFAPIFRALGSRVDAHVFFAHKPTPQQQAAAGFGTPFEWDVDLTSGYSNSFLNNVSRFPSTGHFFGCDTPEIGFQLRLGHFDALLIMGWNLKSFLQGLGAAKRMSLPVFVRGDSHLETPRTRIKSAAKTILFPPFLRMFDGALYVGRRSREYYEKYSYPAQKLFFSPHCVDTEWFASRATADARKGFRVKHGIAEDIKVLLFAGKLVPFKRPLDLVDAVGLLRRDKSDLAILVAGSGELKDEMTLRAAGLQVPIYQLGFCNQTEMPAVYAASDILVLPSDGNETWGLVANEALACGRPIIVSDAVGAGPDLADTRATGRIFPLANIAALSNAISDMLSSPPWPEAVAAKSRAYSVEAAVNGIVAALRQCAPPR
jgi:glycosyltransferase involved in cell wall biosynthesis